MACLLSIAIKRLVTASRFKVVSVISEGPDTGAIFKYVYIKIYTTRDTQFVSVQQ